MLAKIIRAGLVPVLLGWMVAASAESVDGPSMEGSSIEVVQPTAQPVTTAAPGFAPPPLQDYVIGPHDLLEISVFRVDELSRTVRVNSRGLISLPMIGAVQAAGATAAAVEGEIAARLLDCCLQDPQVSIFIKEFVSQRVTVEGEVEKPGVYALTGRTTLLQTIAMAAGVGDLADLGDVRVFRGRQDGSTEQLLYDVRAIREGTQPDPLIQGNDIVVVSRSGGLSVVKSVTDTLRGFIGFGTVR